MIKLIIFFRQPANPDQFEDRFANHVQLIGNMPGVKRTVVNRAIGAPRGEPAYFLIHEVFFTDLAAANYALNAPEGRMAGADLMSFAREITTLLFTEVWGEDLETVTEPIEDASPELEAELAAEQALAVPATASTTPATLSTAAAMTVTAMAGAVANAAPESLATSAPVVAPASIPESAPNVLAPELDTLPTDPEIFGSYPTPGPEIVGVAVPEAMTDEATQAALLDGAMIDGGVVSDHSDVDGEAESLDALDIDSDDLDIEPDVVSDADIDSTKPTPSETPTSDAYHSDGTPKN